MGGTSAGAATSGHAVGGKAVRPAGGLPWCANYGDGNYCLNWGDGVPFYNGKNISVVVGHAYIDKALAGTVTSGSNCSDDWPFTCGNGCNSRYAGHSIYYLEWVYDVNYVVRDYTAQGNVVEISNTLDDGSLWVQSGTWYINVGATDNAGVDCNTGQPLVLTYRPDTYTVWSSCGNCYDAWKQNWAYETI